MTLTLNETNNYIRTFLKTNGISTNIDVVDNSHIICDSFKIIPRNNKYALSLDSETYEYHCLPVLLSHIGERKFDKKIISYFQDNGELNIKIGREDVLEQKNRKNIFIIKREIMKEVNILLDFAPPLSTVAKMFWVDYVQKRSAYKICAKTII